MNSVGVLDCEILARSILPDCPASSSFVRRRTDQRHRQRRLSGACRRRGPAIRSSSKARRAHLCSLFSSSSSILTSQKHISFVFTWLTATQAWSQVVAFCSTALVKAHSTTAWTFWVRIAAQLPSSCFASAADHHHHHRPVFSLFLQS